MNRGNEQGLGKESGLTRDDNQLRSFSTKPDSDGGPMIWLLYSPVCDKLPLVRQAARQYGFALTEVNLWTLEPDAAARLPAAVKEAAHSLWQGEDGFYAWKLLEDGKDITGEFEQRYPLDDVDFPDLSWSGTYPKPASPEIKPLTLARLDHGITGPGSFCLAPLALPVAGQGDWYRIRRQRRDYYRAVEKQIGCFGLTVGEGNATLGFVLVAPGPLARRVGYYTAHGDVEQVVVITCLYVPSQLRRQGLGTRLLRGTQVLCRQLAYRAVDAAATGRAQDGPYTWWGHHPFRKVGFELLEPRDFADGYPDMAIWRWNCR